METFGKMITHNIGSTVISICESTAQCVVYEPTDTYFNEILNFIDTNNYICVGACGKIAQRFVHYAGGTAVETQAELDKIEKTFE